MRVEVISIGDELLYNDILDTNAAYTMRYLQELDVEVTCKVTVADDRGIIADALHSARQRAEIVITSGGLGVGRNDFTRQAVADTTGGYPLDVPPGVSSALLLGTPQDRYFGLLVEDTQGSLICLPGPHREMAYLLETEVLPYLQRKLPAESATRWRMLRTAGIAESTARQLLGDLPLQRGQRLTFTSHAGQTDIRAIVEADSAEAAEHGLEQLTTEISRRLGDNIYGAEGTRLEQVVLEHLRQSGLRVAIAEYETNQVLKRLLQRLPGADSAVFFLPVATLEGFVQDLGLETPGEDLTAWCREVGQRLLERMGGDVALVVFNNVTRSGVQLLITLATEEGASMMQRSFGGHPGNIDQWAGTLGLVNLRRWLLAHHVHNPFARE